MKDIFVEEWTAHEEGSNISMWKIIQISLMNISDPSTLSRIKLCGPMKKEIVLSFPSHHSNQPNMKKIQFYPFLLPAV
jgi:hypothetical protein